jgi:ABC-type lipoprotein export system ATPase subunit
MNEPKLLLADEPTGNLDSATGNGILEVLERLNRAGQTVIMVTHDERIAQRAGRIVTLVDGRIEHRHTK